MGILSVEMSKIGDLCGIFSQNQKTLQKPIDKMREKW
jgi:hypothetical protein